MKYEIIQINYIKEKAKARLSCSVYFLKLTFLSEGLSDAKWIIIKLVL